MESEVAVDRYGDCHLTDHQDGRRHGRRYAMMEERQYMHHYDRPNSEAYSSPRSYWTSSPTPILTIPMLFHACCEMAAEILKKFHEQDIDEPHLPPPQPRRALIPVVPSFPIRARMPSTPSSVPPRINRTLSIGRTSTESRNGSRDIEEQDETSPSDPTRSIFTLRKFTLENGNTEKSDVLRVIVEKLHLCKIPVTMESVCLVGQLKRMPIKDPKRFYQSFSINGIPALRVATLLSLNRPYHLCHLNPENRGILSWRLSYNQVVMSELTLLAAKRQETLLTEEERSQMEIGADCLQLRAAGPVFTHSDPHRSYALEAEILKMTCAKKERNDYKLEKQSTALDMIKNICL